MRLPVAAFLLVVGATLLSPSVIHAQRGGGGFMKNNDPEKAFKDMAKDGVIVIEKVQQPWVKSPLEKFAADKGITNGQITHDQFLQYWAVREDYRGKGGFKKDTPPVKKDTSSETKTDKKAEAPTFKAKIDGKEIKIDGNGGGLFGQILSIATGKGEEKPEKTDSPPTSEAPKPSAPEAAKKPAAPAVPEIKGPYGPGNLPRGLPDWFKKLDTDGDGQVSLAEWRAAMRPLEEFQAMDLNNDGLLTAEEVLHYLANKK